MSDTALTSLVHPNGPHSGRCNAPDAFGISCDTSAWLEPAGGRATHGQAARAALTQLEERYRDGALPFPTVLRSGPPACDVQLPAHLPGYPSWFPRRLGSLWHAHADATCANLATAGRPVRTFTFARRSQAAYGALMAHLTLETELVADLLGINPFGQPAVEDTRERTVQILTKVAH